MMITLHRVQALSRDNVYRSYHHQNNITLTVKPTSKTREAYRIVQTLECNR